MPNSTPRTITRSLGIQCLGLGLVYASSAAGNTTHSVVADLRTRKTCFRGILHQVPWPRWERERGFNLVEIGSAIELINDPEQLEEIIDVLDFETCLQRKSHWIRASANPMSELEPTRLRYRYQVEAIPRHAADEPLPVQ